MTRLANASTWSAATAARACLKHLSKFQTPDIVEGQMYDGTWCQTRGVGLCYIWRKQFKALYLISLLLLKMSRYMEYINGAL